jgi:GxxExxY protein
MNRQDAKNAKRNTKAGGPADRGRLHARREPDADVDKLARAVIGAAIEVHRVLGPGFLESIYEQAVLLELQRRKVPLTRQTMVRVDYRGHPIGEARLDLGVGDRLVVELKAVEALAPIHTAEVLSYLKATGCHLGLLINFNVPVLKDGIKRIILS